ncbi:hypothetical protein GF356_11920, partial [candidate division GN15 bacterium]|nr:hypothetical protein [candidate division GN15 bacterium]
MGSVRTSSPISQIEPNILKRSAQTTILDSNEVYSGVPGVTRLRHYDNLDTVRFTTFSTFRREQTFTTDSVRRLFVEHLCALRDRHRFKLLGYVVMPEHIHLIFWPTAGCMAGRMIGELKSR